MPQHYKLIDGTVEIDGVRMHLTKDRTPLEDAKEKVDSLRVKNGLLALDICTGLGYSAIELGRRGCRVTTIEADPNVVEISKENPESKELFGNPRIRRFLGDAREFVKTLPTESFHVIHHDPPRFSLAGELYSGAFYAELFRVLKRGGRLFHYTGSPGGKTGKGITRGVKERLQQAGFTGVWWREKLQGFLAEKPILNVSRRMRPPKNSD